MNHDEIDPLTAPIEQVREAASLTPPVAPATPPPLAFVPQTIAIPETLVAPATPLEFLGGSATYGSGGPAPVPPIEEARSGRPEETRTAIGSPCECGRWESVNPTTGLVEEEPKCGAVTRNVNSRFAPGHDARFKGMLIRAGERDWRVREIGTDTLRRPTTVAARVSTAMARRVEEGIRRRKR